MRTMPLVRRTQRCRGLAFLVPAAAGITTPNCTGTAIYHACGRQREHNVFVRLCLFGGISGCPGRRHWRHESPCAAARSPLARQDAMLCRLTQCSEYGAARHEGSAGGTGAAAGGSAPGRRAGAHRRPAQARQAHGARAHRPADGRQLVRGVRHVRRAPLRRLRHGEDQDPRRRRRHRLGHHQRPRGLRLRQGLHRVRRLAVGGARAQDHQDPGHGAAEPRAHHRPVRRRRRAHPGGRGGARRLRRGVPAQRAGLRRHPADLRDHGAVRGRRRLLARHDRLHLHGEGHELHVRDRARRGEDRHQRDGDGRGAGRGARAHHQVLDRRPRLRERRRDAAADAPPARLPALQQQVGRAGAADQGQPRPRPSPRSTR